ncbi:MAG: HAD-IIB family hydrolase [Candidatus Pacebacteria bacterium]|nr:HAD-IIB family hydrolase [Candidatus Paceibacterota bacterium]
MNQATDSYNFKVIAFDLDGTLAESKASITPEMSDLLCKLLEKHIVVIISGGTFSQFKKQVIEKLTGTSEKLLSRLLLFPTSGSTLYIYQNNAWICIYEEKLGDDDKARILHAWTKALVETGIVLPVPSYGPVMEDRITQITFSACGQEAPREAKAIWDPDRVKRTALRKVMLPLLPEFAISFGGMTSVDVTRQGVDKAYAIEKLIAYQKIEKGDIMFVGDKLEPGGNDYPARRTGVRCVAVSGPTETADVIKKIIS